jgi:hypothetical protein
MSALPGVRVVGADGPRRFIRLTDKGYEHFVTRGGLGQLNADLPPEAVMIIRDTVTKVFREQDSDSYCI